MERHSRWPHAVGLQPTAAAPAAAAPAPAAAPAAPEADATSDDGAVDKGAAEADDGGADEDGTDEGEHKGKAARRLRQVAQTAANPYEVLGEEHEGDWDTAVTEEAERAAESMRKRATATRTEQSGQQQRPSRHKAQRVRLVTKKMLHRMVGHIGGERGLQHALKRDPTLKLVADDDDPECGACTTAKLKRAPVGSGPHEPWGDGPGKAVALDWVEKSQSWRGNMSVLLFTDAVSGYIMPTFHKAKTSQAAVVGLKEWVADSYKEAAPPGVWILLDRDSTFMGDSLDNNKSTAFYKYVTENLGWRPHFCAPDEHAEHGIAESTVQKVVNITAALLHDCALGVNYWDDALAHACHMLNVMPRSAKPAATTIERQAGSRSRKVRTDPPAYARFGCLVAFRITDKERRGDKAKSRFGHKAELGVFLGWERHATFGSARILSLKTGRLRVVRSFTRWEGITPEPTFTQAYTDELHAVLRSLGNTTAVEHEAEDEAGDEMEGDAELPKEVMMAGEASTTKEVPAEKVVSSASKEVPETSSSASKEVPETSSSASKEVPKRSSKEVPERSSS
jgi:hypothetical protein